VSAIELESGKPGAGKLDLDRMISRRIKIGEVNDAMREMEKGNVVRQVIEF
jgi:Zn-dependent alcohol dehydrogenase